jgi:broad specificity phosphatase PhoE
MEILIVTHGETDYNLKKTNNLDSSLCSLGVNKIKQLSNWTSNNIKLNNFVGLTSPYCSCLETVSLIKEKINIDFIINQTVRDFHLEGKGVQVMSRKNKFKNIKWNSFWDKPYVFFKSEPEENVKKRINSMIDRIDSKKNYFFVTHPSITKYIFTFLCDENVKQPDFGSLTYIKNKKPILYSKVVCDD